MRAAAAGGAWLEAGGARLERALLPPRCLLCAGEGQWLVVPGRQAANGPAGSPRPLPLDLCPYCQAALPASAGAPTAPGASFALELCPWRYAYPLNALVRALKFHDQRVPARVLGALLAAARANCEAPLPALLLPLPLHRQRMATRGYNQSALIARHAAAALGLPVHEGLLQRWRATREQSGLRAQARRANVAGAFRVCAPLPATHLALVDDVITTGATARAAAAALLAAGATQIELWVLARAGRGRGQR